MSEKNRNIPQKPEDRYPDPGIPPEEAWNSMRKMLDSNLPLPQNTASKINLFLVGTVVSVLVVLLTFQTEKTRQSLPHADSTNRGYLSGSSESHIPLSQANPGIDISSPSEAFTTGETTFEKTNPRSAGKHHSELQPPENATSITSYHTDKTLATLPKSTALLYLERKGALKITHNLSLPKNLSVVTTQSIEDKNPGSRKLPRFQWGIQLGGNLPFKGISNYTADLKEKRGGYLLLIPGIWAEKKMGKQGTIQLNIRPYYDYFSGNKLLNQPVGIDSLSPIPSFDPAIQHLRLRKIRSSSASLAYRHHLGRNVRIGGGLTYQLHHHALVLSGQNAPHYQNGETFWISSRDDHWTYIRPYNLSADLEITYNFGKLGIGARVLAPLLSPGKYSPEKSLPPNGQIIFQWRLSPD